MRWLHLLFPSHDRLHGLITINADTNDVITFQDGRIDAQNIPMYGLTQLNFYDTTDAATSMSITSNQNDVTFNFAAADDQYHFAYNGDVAQTFNKLRAVFKSVTPNTVSPAITLFRDDPSPTADDVVGDINFDGENSVGTQTQYVDLWGVITTATNGSEDGRFIINCMDAGTKRTAMDVRPGLTTIEEVSSGATDNAELVLKKIDATPQNSENIGELNFVIEDTGVDTTYAAIQGYVGSLGTQDAGSLVFQMRANSTLNTALSASGDDNNAQFAWSYTNETRILPARS